jgi:hypothetical protein
MPRAVPISRNTDPIAGCWGKQAFASPKHASKASRSMKKHGKPVQHYKCLVCDNWHIGRPAK